MYVVRPITRARRHEVWSHSKFKQDSGSFVGHTYKAVYCEPYGRRTHLRPNSREALGVGDAEFMKSRHVTHKSIDSQG